MAQDFGKPFLTAEWRDVAMLNYEIESAILQPFVQKETKLDSWNGKIFASVVGSLFQTPWRIWQGENSRVTGAPSAAPG